MPDSIKDGQSGNIARVGSSLKLDVSSRVNDRIYYASRDSESAFIVQGARTQAAGGTAEGLLYLHYTGTDRINIKQIALSTEEPGDGLTAFGIWKKPTVSGGAVVTPIIMNFGSNNTLDITTMDGSSDLTVTDGNSLYTVRMKGPGTKIIEFYDAVILGTGDILAIKTNPTTTGTKTRANIMFAESVE